MLPLLLAQELFLLAHDERGRPPAVAYEYGYSGALLMDLVDAGLVAAVGKDLVPVPGAPTHPLLEAAHAALLASARPRSAGYWVNRLRTALKRRPHRALGFYSTSLWPRLNPALACEPRERVARVLVDGAVPDGAVPDVRTALLLSLLRASRLVRGLVDKPNRDQAELRARNTAPVGEVAASISGAVARLIRGRRRIVFVVAVSLSLPIVMIVAMSMLYI